MDMPAAPPPSTQPHRWRRRPLIYLSIGIGVAVVVLAISLSLHQQPHKPQPQQNASAIAPVVSTASIIDDRPAIASTTPPPAPAPPPPTTQAPPPTTTTTSAASSSTTPAGLLEQVLKSKVSTQGDPLQVAALNRTAANMLKHYITATATASSSSNNDNGICLAMDAEELLDSVDDAKCRQVVLTNATLDAYLLPREIVIKRTILIMGHPAFMPKIDASLTVRAFHVVEGGFLEMRFVRIQQGGGIVRERFGFSPNTADAAETEEEEEEAPPPDSSQVREIRGGSIYFDVGALGGNLNTVVFIVDMSAPEYVQGAVEDTLNGVGLRIYGGNICVVDSDVVLLNCHFFYSAILLPLTDVVMYGGDILVLGGTTIITGCTFTVFLAFGNFAGAGLSLCQLGGVAVLTWCSFQDQSVVESIYCAGANLFVGGGVQILTGVDFIYAAAICAFMGIGSYMTGAGVLVKTGVTVENAFGMLANAGAGFFACVGTGVFVQSGVTYNFFSGPVYSALTGGSIFIGAGSSINTGILHVLASSVSSYQGQGGVGYNGAGDSVWVGCPAVGYYGTSSFMGLGGFFSQPAGLMVFVGNPVFFAGALIYFAGLGTVMYHGAGGAVIGHSPVYEAGGLAHVSGNPAPFYIGSKSNSNATRGKGKPLYIGGSNSNSNSNNNDNKKRHERYRQLRRRNQMLADVFDAWEDQDGLDADTEGSSSNKLLMMNVPNVKQVNLRQDRQARAQLASFVPENLLQGSEILHQIAASATAAAGTSSLEQKEEQEKEAPPTTVYLAGEMDYCGLCKVDSVGGPGGDSCETDCGRVEQYFPSILQRQQPSQARQRRKEEEEGEPPLVAAAAGAAEREEEDAFSWEKVPYQPHYLVLGDLWPLTTTAAEKDSAINSEIAWKDALKSWLRQEGFPDVQVAVYKADVSNDLSDVFGGGGSSSSSSSKRGLEETTGSTSSPVRQKHLKVVFIANEEMAAQFLEEALKGLTKKEEGGETEPATGPAAATSTSLVDALKSAFEDDDSSPALCDVDLGFDRNFFVPAYNSPDLLHYKPGGGKEKVSTETTIPAAAAARTDGFLSVLVTDPSKPGLLGLSELKQDKEYLITLVGFPAEVPLEVHLIGQDAATGRQTVTPVLSTDAAATGAREESAGSSDVTDEKGALNFIWTVPSSVVVDGDYYLKVMDPDSGVFGFSQMFRVVSAASAAGGEEASGNMRRRRRRLFGPHMEVDGF